MPRRTEPPADMLSVEEALARILALCDVLPTEIRAIHDAHGQTLAMDVTAPFDIPPLNNTAMDGYAVQAASTADATADRPVRLRVVGELAAGYVYAGTAMGPGEAVRIMTGAPIPEGANAIVPFEETDEAGLRAPGQAHAGVESVGVLKAAQPGANVRRRGEDVRQGATILQRGTVLQAAQIAVLASMGISEVAVVRRPRVAILSTGDELLEPGQPPAPGKIYDSNAAGLAAEVEEFGGIPRRMGIARDTVEALAAKLQKAMGDADLVLTSAGVSHGDFDVVKEVLANEGQIDFWTVRMRPGKPLAFGRLTAPDGRTVPHIGLPGNPVSSMLAFELFGRPLIHKMLGRSPQPRPTLRAITDDVIENPDGRRVYARAILRRTVDGRWHVQLTGPQGSGILTSLAAANALAICPEDQDQITAGEECDVIVLGEIGEPGRRSSG